jgi:dUTP pyrophosphatase
MFSLDYIRKKINDITDNSKNYSMEDFQQEFTTNKVTIDNLDNYKIKLNFKNASNNPDPEYATNGSSGFDLRANLSEPIVIKSGGRVIVPTGLYFEIPANFELQVRARSGLAIKHGITVLNGIGTIDSDYTGEIGVILINHGENDFIVNHGDRIAQGVFSSVINKNFIKLNKVIKITENNERGNGGFGSTGLA